MAQVLTFPKTHSSLQYQVAKVCKIISQDQFQVCTQAQEYLDVRLSADCLLQPMLEDTVVVLSFAHKHYLMHVLEQAQKHTKVFNAGAKFRIEAREFELVAKEANFCFSQTLRFHTRRLMAKIPFLEAKGGQWLSVLKRSWFKSEETVQDLGHYVLDTQSMHETHENLKITKTPLLVEKTDSHHIHTDKFLVD